MNNVSRIVLFDQDCQQYRQEIYVYLADVLKGSGYSLKVYGDKNKVDRLYVSDGLVELIDYSFLSFLRVWGRSRRSIIIQFVWLRYLFILPFMVLMKVIKQPVIVWSHGVNLQNKEKRISRLPYEIRQLLASALVIYTPDQFQYIRYNKSKTFVAYNTIVFKDLTEASYLQFLNSRRNLESTKVLLAVGRWNVNNRSAEDLISLSDRLKGANYIIKIIGPDLPDRFQKECLVRINIDYLGAIYNHDVVNAWYRRADVFIMPGAVGLAINQSFNEGTPILLKDVNHGPEAYYFENGINGELYDNIDEMVKGLDKIFANYNAYVDAARRTAKEKMGIDRMIAGLIEAVDYVRK